MVQILKHTFLKNTDADVMNNEEFRLSLIYHKTLTRSEGSGFGIMSIVTFPTIQKISRDWSVVNGGIHNFKAVVTFSHAPNRTHKK